MRFGLFLLVLFPITELMVLIKVGSFIGVLPTIGMVLLTASTGLWLLRREGFSTLARARQRIASGEIPGREMMEGLVIGCCGALLLAPGFITDCIALCGLIPPIRKRVVDKLLSNARLQSNFAARASQNHFEAGFGSTVEGGFNRQHSRQDVIDGEFRRED